MFEGKRLTAALDVRDTDEAGVRPLRPVEWRDLASRLQSSIALRQIIGRPDGPEDASFDAGSARWIAEHARHFLSDTDFLVNPEASAKFKRDVGKDTPPMRSPTIRGSE